MAQHDRIQKITGAEADAALTRAYDHFADPQELRDELDAHAYMRKCRADFDADVRKDRVENVATEIFEAIGAAPAAGALAAWRTEGGFPIGEAANWVLGVGAKAASIFMVAQLPKFEDMCDSPPPSRRLLRSVARSGKVLLHSQVSMMARDWMEND